MLKPHSEAPEASRKAQEWLVSIITQPIDKNSCINQISPSGNPIELEAATWVSPSPTLQPFQRVELYNKQYWWRLLKVLQDSFPLLTRLFGAFDFNQKVGFPYLAKYPPNHWSLNNLGDRMLIWVEKEYLEKDVKLISHAVKIDLAYTHAFFAKELTPLSVEDISFHQDILEIPLYLQRHVHLFELPYDLFSFRDEFLKQESEYWEEHEFPKLSKAKSFYILFRKRNNFVTWKNISEEEFTLLKKIEKGSSIEQICDWIESESQLFQEKATQSLSSWFQEWTKQGLLTKS